MRRPTRNAGKTTKKPRLKSAVARRSSHAQSAAPDALQTRADALERELTEALEQQTATSEVLKVISRSTFDLQAVLNTLAESAARLCTADRSIIRRRVGDLYVLAASYGFLSPEQRGHRESHSQTPDRRSAFGRALAEGRTVYIPDQWADAEYDRDRAKTTGSRSALAVPLMREGEAIGVLTVISNKSHAFTQKQIELVETFADQAVIAIENARLLNELRQRTDDLSESLEQQTATSEVLKVISSSPGELQPVFNTMLENATRICEAKCGLLQLLEGDGFRAVAMHGVPQAYVESRGQSVLRPPPNHPLDRLLRTKQIDHVTDVLSDPANVRGGLAEIAGARTILNVPMLKDDELIGVFSIYRAEIPSLYRQADRAGDELRRAGRDCHRERKAAQRAAPAHR